VGPSSGAECVAEPLYTSWRWVRHADGPDRTGERRRVRARLALSTDPPRYQAITDTRARPESMSPNRRFTASVKRRPSSTPRSRRASHYSATQAPPASTSLLAPDSSGGKELDVSSVSTFSGCSLCGAPLPRWVRRQRHPRQPSRARETRAAPPAGTYGVIPGVVTITDQTEAEICASTTAKSSRLAPSPLSSASTTPPCSACFDKRASRPRWG
jgi:hypothetical protein